MENKDPLFENIRRNSKKIEHAPSGDAWTKLEARLNKHEHPVARWRRLPGQNLMSVAASVLLLVGLVFVISQTVLKPDHSMASAEIQAMPHQVEDLPLLGIHEAINSPQMAEYQRKINANPRGVIKEGGYHKKLVAQSISQGKIMAIKDAHGGNGNMANMKYFKWILGTWISKTQSGTSTETWKEVSPRHFEGTGSFTNADNQAIFTEEMALFEKNNNIYFEATTQSAGEKVTYILKALENNRFLFQNKTVDFPSHVMIDSNDSGGFMISFKNFPPVAVPESSILLENGRNVLESKKITRMMNRKI